MIIDADEPDYDDQIDELLTTSKPRKLFNNISKTDSPSPIKTRSQSTLETPNTSKKTAENFNKFVRHSFICSIFMKHALKCLDMVFHIMNVR